MFFIDINFEYFLKYLLRKKKKINLHLRTYIK